MGGFLVKQKLVNWIVVIETGDRFTTIDLTDGGKVRRPYVYLGEYELECYNRLNDTDKSFLKFLDCSASEKV